MLPYLPFTSLPFVKVLPLPYNTYYITNSRDIQYANITNFEVEVNPSFYEYGVDYDLGDICDVVINDLTISYKCCIIEIYEVYKAGEQNISLVLGDKIPTNLAKARLT